MANGHKYPRDWETVNPDVYRLRINGGWLIMTRMQILVGGKEFYVNSQPVVWPDEHDEWQLLPR